MVNSESCDLLVIGGGPGGYVCAIKASQLGVGKVICVDRRERLGGTCLNVGCIPSKALLESSHYYYKALNKMGKHGIKFDGLSFDMVAMMEQKDKAVSALGGGIDGLLKKNKITKMTGEASFLDSSRVRVVTKGGEVIIDAKKVVIATGSEITMLPNIKVDGKVVITSDEALSLPNPPKDLVVIGGGAIGLELGSVWSRLGSNVNIIEYMDEVAPSFDKEISSKLRKYLVEQGLQFQLGFSVVGVSVSDGKANVEIVSAQDPNNKRSISADNVIVCVGRKPHVTGLNISAAGIEMDDRGRIKVDKRFCTSSANVYAIGDVVSGPMLAHKAEDDGVAVAEILTGGYGHVNYDHVPGVIYTAPEAAMIGKTEEQVKALGVEYKVGKFSFTANSRARTSMNDAGMVKVIVDARTDEILGVHMLHDLAGELIVPALIGMNYQASSEDLAIPSYPHPGYSEAFKEACLAAYFKAIHS